MAKPFPSPFLIGSLYRFNGTGRYLIPSVPGAAFVRGDVHLAQLIMGGSQSPSCPATRPNFIIALIFSCVCRSPPLPECFTERNNRHCLAVYSFVSVFVNVFLFNIISGSEENGERRALHCMDWRLKETTASHVRKFRATFFWRHLIFEHLIRAVLAKIRSFI